MRFPFLAFFVFSILLVSASAQEQPQPPEVVTEYGFLNNLFSVTQDFATITTTNQCKATYENRCNIDGNVMYNCAVTDICRCYVKKDTIGVCGGGSSTTTTTSGWSCVDTDGGKVPLVRGIASQRFVSSIGKLTVVSESADECDPNSNSRIWEAYCKTDTEKNTGSTLLSCPSGTTCSDGKCTVTPKPTECTGKPYGYVISQSCESDVAVRLICINGVATRATNTCSNLGKICSAGVCEQKPSTGGTGTGIGSSGGTTGTSGGTTTPTGCSVDGDCGTGIFWCTSKIVKSFSADTCTVCAEGYELKTAGALKGGTECSKIAAETTTTTTIRGRVPSIDVEELGDAEESDLAGSYCWIDLSCSSGKCQKFKKLGAYSNVQLFKEDLEPLSGLNAFQAGASVKTASDLSGKTSVDSSAFIDATFIDAHTSGVSVTVRDLDRGGVCIDGTVPRNFFEKFAQDLGVSTTTFMISVGFIVALALFLGGNKK